MNSSLSRSSKLHADQIIDTIENIREADEIRCVVFAGGEPWLLKSELLKSIQYLADEGINSRMVTNASWAINNDKADKVLKKLKDAGLDELNLSADDYHLPFIPLENVLTVWNCSKTYDFSTVLITVSRDENSTITADHILDLVGRDVPVVSSEDSQIFNKHRAQTTDCFYGVNEGKLQFIGRGSNLRQNVEGDKTPEKMDTNVPCPFVVSSAAISAKGDIWTCCGFEMDQDSYLNLGNANAEPASTILRRARDDVFVNALAVLGPHRIRAIVKEVAPELISDITPPSICEACHDVFAKKEIQKYLPDIIPFLAAEICDRKNSKYRHSVVTSPEQDVLRDASHTNSV
jgi:organic radical activating enzyme